MTTKRYRLKAEAAEHEFEISDRIPVAGMFVFSIGGHILSASRELFEEIVPPIPPEPEPGAYLIGDWVAVRFGGSVWHSAEGSCYWPELYESIVDESGPDVQIVRLVPERPAPAVELPWRLGEVQVHHIKVGSLRVQLHVGDEWARITAEEARAAGHALIAAADQAEAVGT